MERRGPLILALVGMIVGLLAIFLWDDVLAPALGLDGATGGDDTGEQMGFDDAQELEALRRRAGLRGLPAAEFAKGGTGVLRGSIYQHVAGGEPRPLPGVEILVLGHDGEREHRYTLTTDASGAFEELKAQALFGYLVLIRHAPFKEKRLQGIVVRTDRVTDVGTIVLGAPTTLAGEVRTAEGGPPRGAVVQAYPDRSRPDSFDLRRGLFELQAAFDAVGEASVGSDGQFAIEGLPPGRYLLRVSAPGYATAFRSNVFVTFDERSADPRITLDRGAGYFGRILDEDGLGVGGARLLAVVVPGERAIRIDRVDTMSEPDGSYRLDTLTPGVRYFVETWAEGFAPYGQFVQVPGGVTERDFQLLRSGRVEGRVTDVDTGAGIAGAEVTIVAGSFTRMSPVSAVTDASGWYALPNVSAGPVLLFSATAPDYQQADDVNMKSVKGLKIVAGETTLIDWPLVHGGMVSGVVVTPEGERVPYATVALIERSRRWAGELTALSGVDGHYEIRGLRPAEYELAVSAPGFAPVTDGEATRLQVPESLAPLTFDVVVARGATVYGVVKTPEGAPLSGTQLHVKAENAKDAGLVRDLVAISGAGGSYTIAGIPPLVPVHLVAEHDTYVRTTSPALKFTPGEQRELMLALRPGVTVHGRVTDVRGQGVAQARVRWGNVDDAEERRLRDAFRADEYLGQRTVYTGEDGTFALENMEPGRTLVKVEREGYAPWYRKDLQIGTEADPPLLHVELDGALEVSGRVVSDRSGAPIGDCVVYCRERNPAEGAEEDPGKVKALVSTNTGPDGRYVLPQVPPGRYEVVVWFAAGYVAAAQDWRNERVRKVDVASGSKGVDFRLLTEAQAAEEVDEG